VIISLLAVLISPLASGNPDGLEKVASDLGFLGNGLDAPFQILPDYSIPFLGETALSTIMAGAVGAIVLIGIIILLGRNLRRQDNS
jgi:cobalt/nickel transport system permease protein